MKKLLTLFAFAVTMLSFAACSSNDDDNDEPKKDAPSIVGTWKLTKEIKYASSSDKTGIENKPSTTESYIHTFTSDGKFETVYKDTAYSEVDEVKHTGTYSLKDGKIYSYSQGISNNPVEYRFSDDNTLILTNYKDSDDVYKYDSYYSRQ